MANYRSEMEQLVEVAGALSDEGRVRILVALARGEVCVCQVIELLGLAPSTISKHLLVLKQAGLITARKQSRWMYYRLAGPEAGPVVQGAIEWVRRALEADAKASTDAKRIEGIKKIEPTVLCCAQRECRSGTSRSTKGDGNDECGC